ncbi:hypothetical protein DFH09DRAFT_1300558 [Mycena vulgaris]|nr:hypothetical protein DFH09DRAFT_1300558 [Mycena vulgaris]
MDARSKVDWSKITAEESAELYWRDIRGAMFQDLTTTTRQTGLEPVSILGFGSKHHTDIQVRAVNTKYSVVMWGGPGAEAIQSWSFHIAHARPGHQTSREFDETLDHHVDLEAERIQILHSARV